MPASRITSCKFVPILFFPGGISIEITTFLSSVCMHLVKCIFNYFLNTAMIQSADWGVCVQFVQEEATDIASLLAKLTDHDDEFAKLAETLHRYHRDGTPDPKYSLPNGVDILYGHGVASTVRNRGRRFTVSMASLNFTLRFRFSGHYNVVQDRGGIETFLHPTFMKEFACELGSGISKLGHCAPLSALVLNSGQHDLWHGRDRNITREQHIKHFAIHLDRLLAILSPHLTTSTTQISFRADSSNVSKYPVVWRGNTLNNDPKETELLKELDVVTKGRVSSFDIPFVNVADIVSSIPNFPACCSISLVHFGTQEFSLYRKVHQVRNKFTATSLVTNALLRNICPIPTNMY